MPSSSKFCEASTSRNAIRKKLSKDASRNMPSASASRMCSTVENTDDFQVKYSLERACSTSTSIEIAERFPVDNDNTTKHERVNSGSSKKKAETAIQDNKSRWGLDKKECSLADLPTTSSSSHRRGHSDDDGKPCDRSYLERADLHKIASRVLSISDFYKNEGKHRIHEKYGSPLSPHKAMQSQTCQKPKGGRDAGKKEFCGSVYPQSSVDRSVGSESAADRASGLYPNRYMKAKGLPEDKTESKGLGSRQTRDVSKKSELSRNRNHLPTEKQKKANTDRPQSSVDARKLRATQSAILPRRTSSPELVVLWKSPKRIASKKPMATSTVASCFRTSSSSSDLETSAATLPLHLDRHKEASKMKNDNVNNPGTSQGSCRRGRRLTESSVKIVNTATYTKLHHNINDREKGDCMETANVSGTTLTYNDTMNVNATQTSAVIFQTDKAGDDATASNTSKAEWIGGGDSDSDNTESESSEGYRITDSFAWKRRSTCRALLVNAISRANNAIAATARQDENASNSKASNETFVTVVGAYSVSKSFKHRGTSPFNVPDANHENHENNGPHALEQATNFGLVDESLSSQHPLPQNNDETSDELSRKAAFDVDASTGIRERATLIRVQGNTDDLPPQRNQQGNVRAVSNAQQLTDDPTITNTSRVPTPTTIKIDQSQSQSQGTEHQRSVRGSNEAVGKSMRLHIERKSKYETAETKNETENGFEFYLRVPARNIKMRGLTDASAPVNEIIVSTNFTPGIEVVDNVLRLTTPIDGISNGLPVIETKASSTGYPENRGSSNAGLTGKPRVIPGMQSTVVRGWVEAQEALDQQYKLNADALRNEYFGIINEQKKEATDNCIERSELDARPSGIGDSTENANISLGNPYRNRCTCQVTSEMPNTSVQIKGIARQERNQFAEANANAVYSPRYMLDIPSPCLQESPQQQQSTAQPYPFNLPSNQLYAKDPMSVRYVDERPVRKMSHEEEESHFSSQQRDSYSSMESNRIISTHIIDYNYKAIDVRAGSSQKSRSIAENVEEQKRSLHNQSQDSISDGPSTRKQAARISNTLNRLGSELTPFQQPYLAHQVPMASLQLPVPGIGSQQQILYDNLIDGNNCRMVKERHTKENDACCDFCRLEGIPNSNSNSNNNNSDQCVHNPRGEKQTSPHESHYDLEALSIPVNEVDDNQINSIEKKIEGTSSPNDSDDDDNRDANLSDFISIGSTHSIPSFIQLKKADRRTGEAYAYTSDSDSICTLCREFVGCTCMRSVCKQVKVTYLESTEFNLKKW